MARVPPLPPGDWGDDEIAALRRAWGDGGVDIVLSSDADAHNVVGTLLRHPRLAGRFLAYNNVLLDRPTVAPRLRELMVLRVATRTGSAYEWAQHERMARSCGISDEEITAASHGDDAGWSPVEAALLTATDQLLDHHRVDDATWAELAGHLDDRQLVEVLFTVGTYTCLAMVLNSVGLEPDPDLRVPEPPT